MRNVWRNKANLGFLLLLGPLSSHANDAVFMAGARGEPPSNLDFSVSASPGEKLTLSAGFYKSNRYRSFEASQSELYPDPAGTYLWHLRCAKDKDGACVNPNDTFEITSYDREFTLPAEVSDGATLEVTHTSAEGAIDGKIEIKVVQGAPQIDRFYRPDGGYGGSSRTNRQNYAQNGTATSGSSGGGFGGGSSGDSEDSGWSRSGHGYRSDSSYGGYGGGSSFGGGGGGPNTTARGYNRDSQVPVVSCVNEAGADCASHVICDDEKKALRAHAPPPALVVAAAPKKARAAKAAPKKKRKAAPKKAGPKKKSGGKAG